jgi:hypothetical protein
MPEAAMTAHDDCSSRDWRPVAPRACHKALQHNAFIRRFRQTGPDRFELLAEIDAKREGHFFDHPIDHVPGMLSACIMRQAALVVFHEAWGASYDDKYLLDRVAASFHCFADHTQAIRVEALAVDVKRRGDKVLEATVRSRLLQGTSPFAEGEATIRALSPSAYERIHRRGR